MRQFDLSPLYRSTIGFDRLLNMIDQAAGLETMPGYPPYNIERTGGNAYRISVAVAGFAATDLWIETKENTLALRGSRERDGEERNGEAGSALSGHCGPRVRAPLPARRPVQVTGASLENGLLHVDLVRELPEAQKPRQIPIAAAAAKPAVATQAA